MDVKKVFIVLNRVLEERGLEREIIICGGAALIALGILSRQTRDVDVLDPKIDDELRAISDDLAASLGLRKGWLNNGPAVLTKEMATGWESRCIEVFNGSN